MLFHFHNECMLKIHDKYIWLFSDLSEIIDLTLLFIFSKMTSKSTTSEAVIVQLSGESQHTNSHQHLLTNKDFSDYKANHHLPFLFFLFKQLNLWSGGLGRSVTAFKCDDVSSNILLDHF